VIFRSSEILRTVYFGSLVPTLWVGPIFKGQAGEDEYCLSLEDGCRSVGNKLPIYAL
jgi:hypothetical protein